VLDHTQAKLGVPGLGVHLYYRPGDVVHCVERCFCMRWRLVRRERVCVSHYMKDNCMNIWRSIIQIGQEEDYLSLVGNRLGNILKII